MSFTKDMKLPSYEDLECPVVNVTAPVLRAGSFHLAKYCDLQFKVRSSHPIRTNIVFLCLGIHVMSTGEWRVC